MSDIILNSVDVYGQYSIKLSKDSDGNNIASVSSSNEFTEIKNYTFSETISYKSGVLYENYTQTDNITGEAFHSTDSIKTEEVFFVKNGIVFNINGDYMLYTFNSTPYSQGEKINISTSSDSYTGPTCFLYNSMIETPNGLISVQDIHSDDEVTVYVGGKLASRKIVWVGKSHTVIRQGFPDDEAGYPVRILKDAISDGVPFKDMLITAEHCLFFDGQFVPARMLVNGRSIFFDKSITSYDYYHIETEEHSVIMADGMLTESYLDTGNRRAFSQKGNVVSIGGSRNLSWDDAAVPLTVSRETIEPLFRKIENRADKAGFAIQAEARPLTNDSDLHLTTDTGAVIRPVRQNNGRVMFMIPSGVESVRIVSNASRPCDVIGPFIDDRRSLGVLIGTVTLFESNRTRTLTDYLHNAQLSGWNNVEEGTMRWTNGNALLPLGERAPEALALMTIEVRAAGPYVLDETISEHQALKA